MNNNSGVNTILLVVILVAIVGFGIWYFQGGMNESAEEEAGLNVNVEMPGGDDSSQ